jgi:hypothetical protein
MQKRQQIFSCIKNYPKNQLQKYQNKSKCRIWGILCPIWGCFLAHFCEQNNKSIKAWMFYTVTKIIKTIRGESAWPFN